MEIKYNNKKILMRRFRRELPFGSQIPAKASLDIEKIFESSHITYLYTISARNYEKKLIAKRYRKMLDVSAEEFQAREFENLSHLRASGLNTKKYFVPEPYFYIKRQPLNFLQYVEGSTLGQVLEKYVKHRQYPETCAIVCV